MRTRISDAYSAATRSDRGLRFFPFTTGRPLFAALAAVAFAIGITILIFPRRMEDYEPYREETVQLTGTVCGLEPKLQDDTIVWRMMLTDVQIEKMTGTDDPADSSDLSGTADSADLSVPAGSVDSSDHVDSSHQETVDGAAEKQSERTDLSLSAKEKVLCVLDYEPRADMSARVRVRGKIFPFRSAMNEGEFDLRLYYHILRVEFSLRNTYVQAASGPTDRLAAALYHFKKTMSSIIDRLFSTENAPVFKAMLLGEKGLLEEETRELYQGAGIIHILSISGLHMSLLGMGLFSLTGKCRIIPLPVRAAASIIVVFLYGKMIGMGTSVFRALIMLTLYIIAKAIGRTYDILTAASIAAVLLLLDQPLYLLHTGFQFSFGAVLAIGFLVPALPGRVLKAIAIPLVTLPVYLWSFGTFPITSLLLNMIVIPLMTAVMVSAGGAVLLDGMLYGIISAAAFGPLKAPAFLKWIVRLIGLPAELILDFYRFLAESSEKIPGHELVFGRPSLIQVFIFYIMLFAMAAISVRLQMPHMRRRIEAAASSADRQEKAFRKGGKTGPQQGNTLRKISQTEVEPGNTFRRDSATDPQQRNTLWKESTTDMLLRCAAEKICILMHLEDNRERKIFARICAALWVSAALFVLTAHRQPAFEMDVLYVGQGDGILISSEGRNFLVDGGSSTKKDLAKYTLLPFLHCKGIDRLDGVIITHDDGDHCSGLLELLDAAADKTPLISISAVYLPDISEEAKGDNYHLIEDLSTLADIPVCYISRGQRIRTGSLTLDCLHPARGASYEDANEYSTALLLSHMDDPDSAGEIYDGSDSIGETSDRSTFTALLTGDLEGQGEKDLLEYLENTNLLRGQKPVKLAGLPNTCSYSSTHGPNRSKQSEQQGQSERLEQSDQSEEVERPDLSDQSQYSQQLGQQEQSDWLDQSHQAGLTEPDITLLKVAHHGSKNATSQEFLQTVHPETAVISAGIDNMYGHPSDELLERLRTASPQSAIFRTDLQGEITIWQKKGGEYQVKTF